MRDRLHALVVVSGMSMLGYGLWLIAPCAMFIGLGSSLIGWVVLLRMPRKESHGTLE